MTPFSCPYCFEPLSETDKNDRSRTVFWYPIGGGRQHAHIECWSRDEIAFGPDRPKLEPETSMASRIAFRKDH